MHTIRFFLLLVTGLAGGIAAADPFAGLPDPTRPGGWQDQGAPAVQGLVLQATTVSGNRRHAIISGQRVAVGDRIQGATVTGIQPFQVTLMRAGREITLRLTPPLAKEQR